MAEEPARWHVEASPALFENARTVFGSSRSASGFPSIDDFTSIMVPHLIEAVAVTWASARPVPGFDGLVRELTTRPHVMFGPARVTALEDGDTIWLIGFEIDMAYWNEIENPDD